MFWIYFVIYTTILSNSKPYATLFVNQPKPIVIYNLCVYVCDSRNVPIFKQKKCKTNSFTVAVFFNCYMWQIYILFSRSAMTCYELVSKPGWGKAKS